MIDSVGTLYAIQDLFDHLHQHEVLKDDFLEGFLKYGSSTSAAVYETASKLSWIATSKTGHLVTTELGRAAHRGDNRAAKLRFQLASVIETAKPVWAALLPKGRKEARAGFPDEILQCFEEALLFDSPTDEIVDWWDTLSSAVREVTQLQLLVTGRTGEKLTVKFEGERTGKLPKWLSVETAYSGYDVLSVFSEEDPRPLKIEVKCSDRPFKGACIFVTEHEWRTACQSPETYIFHVWLLNPEPALFIVSQAEVLRHIPENRGKGMWRNVCIQIGAITHPSKNAYKKPVVLEA